MLQGNIEHFLKKDEKLGVSEVTKKKFFSISNSLYF